MYKEQSNPSGYAHGPDRSQRTREQREVARVLSILFSVSSLEGRNQLNPWQASSGKLKQTAKGTRFVCFL